jgi:hypothetical protein
MPDMDGTLTDSLKTSSRDAVSGGDRYLALLAFVLLGYALMGKGFAYLGFPPLYVGEIALLTGIVVFLRIGAVFVSLATLPALLLVALMALALARTVPFIGSYGVDSLRDSVVVVYGWFAFIVIGLLLEDARRINTVLRYYGIMLTSLPAMLAGFWLQKYYGEYIPRLFGPVPIVDIGASAFGTHLAGIGVFVLIGYRKVRFLWLVVWFAALALIGATNRGATLAVIVPVAIAMLVLGRYRLMLATVMTAVGLFAGLLALESTFGAYDEAKGSMERPVSAHQIVENAKSIVGQSGEQAEGTKKWRLNWWDIIINDTIHGPDFWTGRGFGINLADADGFATGMSGYGHDRPPTRSPHNVHMTLLARAGIPGLVLWALMLMSWFGMLTRTMLTARARGHERWVELLLFVVCYATAILINASFDVTLEGPMQGIWFWCLFGFGIGSVMIYRAQHSDGIEATTQ